MVLGAVDHAHTASCGHAAACGVDPLHGSDPWSLAAVGAGKAAGKAAGKGCFLCGGPHFAKDCPENKSKGKGKGAKGKGKGLKGPGGRQGWGICRDWQRGHCPRGDSCPWAHAKVPMQLHSITNLVLEDLGDVVLKNGVYEVEDESKVDAGAVLANIGEELKLIRLENEGWTKVAGGSGSGFPRQPDPA